MQIPLLPRRSSAADSELMMAPRTTPTSRGRLSFLGTLGALAWAACQPALIPTAAAAQGSSPGPACVNLADLLAKFSTQGQGFEVGKAGLRVYVAFDPQCPECVAFWSAALPLSEHARFIWLPVAVLNPMSEPQGAAILASPDPTAAMAHHVATFNKAQSGPLTIPSALPMAAREAVWANSRILRRSGAKSVPFAVFRQASGQVAAIAEPLGTQALRSALGLG